MIPRSLGITTGFASVAFGALPAPATAHERASEWVYSVSIAKHTTNGHGAIEKAGNWFNC